MKTNYQRLLALALSSAVLTAGLLYAMINKVNISIRDAQRFIESNGLPDHAPGQFPRRGNPNTIAEQNYSFRVPVNPQIAAAPTSSGRNWFGVALNGVPFEPGTAEYWNNDFGSGWNYEAVNGSIDLGLDEHNAHVQPNGAYHYHALPKGLVERLGGDGKKMLLVGYAADGFPIYTAYGLSEARDPASPLRKMKSSFRLKQGNRPDGPGGKYDGTFTEDYEYVKESGDLDECNGRVGVTPEYPQGIYHYYITEQFPYVARQLRGTPDPSFQKGGGAGPRGPVVPGGAGLVGRRDLPEAAHPARGRTFEGDTRTVLRRHRLICEGTARRDAPLAILRYQPADSRRLFLYHLQGPEAGAQAGLAPGLRWKDVDLGRGVYAKELRQERLGCLVFDRVEPQPLPLENLLPTASP